jgi:ribosomal protein S18 acetylase RimI-like enzyme
VLALSKVIYIAGLMGAEETDKVKKHVEAAHITYIVVAPDSKSKGYNKELVLAVCYHTLNTERNKG